MKAAMEEPGHVPEIYARLYDLMLIPADWLGLRKWRVWATSLPTGKILEIGIGTGLNVPHYKRSTVVFAIDPTAEMLKLASLRSTKFKNKTHLVRSRGESLPFPDASFDAALGTLVFCTVADPNLSFRELYRVLKPGAPVRLFEHVRLGKGPGSMFQDFLTPVWKRIAGGCHLNRDTLTAAESAGFKIINVRTIMGGILIAVDAMKPGPFP